MNESRLVPDDESRSAAEPPLVIAIDGPAAAGKSTTARQVATRLGLLYVDSGAMYRALALKLLRTGLDPGEPAALGRFLAETEVDLAAEGAGTRVLLDAEDVTEALRDETVATLASTIAPWRLVRAYLVGRQRALAARLGVVMEGRDIGTVVLPDAALKIYLVAELDVRAARRAAELAARGTPTDLAAVRQAIAERDQRDLERDESPLRAAPGAITIDTSRMTISEQVEAVVAEVERLRGRLPQRPHPPAAPARAGKATPDEPDLELDPEIRGFYRWIRTLARGLFGFSFGWKIHGTEHLPTNSGFIVASNHVSWVDPALLGAAASRRLGYLAKVELFAQPGFRHLIVALGAVPIRRQVLDRRALEITKKVLQAGLGLVLFPEGTRSRSGKLGPGKPGVAMLAAEARVPVVPAYIAGTRDLASALLRRTPLVIRFGAPLAPPPSGHGPEWREAMRAYTERIMAAIAELAPDHVPGAGRLPAAKISGQGGHSFHAV